MRARPERVLLFRSGRHLGVAVEALRRLAPACEITVVAMASATASLDAAGIEPGHRIVYDATAFFRPWPFVCSPAWRLAVRGRFDRVCVLWNDPDGAGHANVDYTALTVSPRGFAAITPDGTIVPRPTGVNARRTLARAAFSLVVGAMLVVTLWMPARLAAVCRRVVGRPRLA